MIANKILFEEKVIERFDVDKKYYEIIKKAIVHHNKKDIDEKVLPLNENELLHSKIIRDADKLAIFTVFIKKTNFIKPPKKNLGVLSKDIYEDFINKKIINKKSIKSYIDNYIFFLGMTHDLNFDISYKEIKKMNYSKKLYKIFLPHIEKENMSTFLEVTEAYNKFINSK